MGRDVPKRERESMCVISLVRWDVRGVEKESIRDWRCGPEKVGGGVVVSGVWRAWR